MDDKILEIKNISKRRGTKQVLDNVSFSILRGEIFGLVGKNGAGKTTLIKVITSMLSPDEGQIIVCGKDLRTEREEALRNIGSVVETPIMYEYMTGRQNLNYTASLLDNITEDEIEKAIQCSKLGDKIDEKVKKYSLGMKQRLGLAQALMGNISLLILDEPTNGLDPIGVIDLNNTINTLVKEKNVSVFISSHILSEIENICTMVVFIDSGKIINIQKIDDKFNNNIKNMFIKTNSPKKSSKIVRDLNCAKIIKIKKDGILISMTDKSDDIFNLLKILHEAKISVEGFFEIKPDLEHRFVEMMGDNKNE